MVPKPKPYKHLTAEEADRLAYGGWFNQMVGETYRSLLGDEWLVQANDAELFGVAFATAATTVVGGYYLAPAAAGAVGLTGTKALAFEGALLAAGDYLAVKGAGNLGSAFTDGGEVAPISASELAGTTAFGAVGGPILHYGGTLVSGSVRRLLPGITNKLDNALARFSQPQGFAKPKTVTPEAPPALFNSGKRTVELADEALLKKLRQRGFDIDQSADIQRYLDYRDANAATFRNNDLLLRPDARKVEVLEEYLHNIQEKIGLGGKLTPHELEIHVKEFMLRHKNMLGISDGDAKWLQGWLNLNR